ncbi:MAG: YqaE/Pmp3 family membrane protein [Methylorubrum populi]
MSTLVKILIAFFLPPISVLMTNGIGIQFLFNILLCLLFYLPGSIHALYLLLRDR